MFCNWRSTEKFLLGCIILVLLFSIGTFQVCLTNDQYTAKQLVVTQKEINDLRTDLLLLGRVNYYITQSRQGAPLSFDDLNDIGLKVIELSNRYNVPIYTLLGIWGFESNFEKYALGSSGEQGLGQVMYETFKIYGNGNFTDWEDTAEASVKYYMYLRTLFDSDHDRIIAAYNTGPGYTREITMSKARIYVKRVKFYINNARSVLNV